MIDKTAGVMKLSAVLKILAIISAIAFINPDLYAWTLSDLITGRKAGSEFDPEKDILFLPELGQKGLFDSIDDLSIMRKKDVRKFINLYLSKGRDYTIRAIERSAIYKDELNAIFGENPDIPADIACLPLLESCFNPQAVSRSRAVGLWQFMSNTSTPLGLKKTLWIDERRHIEKSTKAAVRHLRGLYRIFGSWELALLAYNGGAGHVRRSLEEAGTWNFWDLLARGVLKVETNEYVPRFAALLIIYRNQELFGISGEIKNVEPVKTSTVAVNYNVSLEAVERFSGTPVAVIRSLNPELLTGAVPPGGYRLILPSENAQRLENNMESLAGYIIAVKTKPVDREALAKKNKDSGAKIKNTAEPLPKNKVAVKQYRVKKGDTIFSIAKKNNRTPSEIIQLNKIANIDKITPGKVILIPN